jgi:glycosyltransferase involved in cell wall biosynthesis
MSATNGALKKLRRLFRRGSLQRIRSAAVRRLARRYAGHTGNVLSAYGCVLNPDRPPMLAPSNRRSLRINWILPSLSPAQGGVMTIARAIQQLENSGHENRLYILDGIPKGAAHAKEALARSYFKLNAEIYPLIDPNRDPVQDSDALVATSWTTAYSARAIGNTSRKYYFVQDLEYMFYAPGSLHAFARSTYTFGFHGITAGTWIADMLKREFGMQCTPFGFSYDRNAYGKTGQRTYPEGKKRVLYYARPETERRGFELGILALSLVAKHLPEVEFILVGFTGGWLDIPFKAILPGILPPNRLGALYRSCDAALVLSHTNLSLVPLELMACGCAVVSNSGPNTEWLLNENNARLANADPVSLSNALIGVLQNDEARRRLSANAFAFAEATDWQREIRIIESALTTSVRTPEQEALRV